MNEKLFDATSKATSSSLGLPVARVDHARDRAADRCIHIENDQLRNREIRGVLPEEGASVALETVGEWLKENFPEAVERYNAEFTRK